VILELTNADSTHDGWHQWCTFNPSVSFEWFTLNPIIYSAITLTLGLINTRICIMLLFLPLCLPPSASGNPCNSLTRHLGLPLVDFHNSAAGTAAKAFHH